MVGFGRVAALCGLGALLVCCGGYGQACLAGDYVKKGTWFETLLATTGGRMPSKSLLDRLRGEFSDPEDLRQIMIETRAVFALSKRVKPGPAGLAMAYAAGCEGATVRSAATVLAAAARGAEDLPKVRALFYKSRLPATLVLARRTLAYVAPAGGQEAMRGELRTLADKIATAGDDADWVALHTELCRLRRRILFTHPALRFEKLLINLHDAPKYSHNCDQYLGMHSRPGRGLAVLSDWKSRPVAAPLLPGKLPVGDVAHPTLSFDAKRVVFGFCDHTKRDRRFFIYEAAVDGSSVRQLTGTASDPMEGWGGRRTVRIEDFDPAYLPDGGIVFTSTRSQDFGRCHGGRYTPAYLLYRADGDGGNIRQISFGEANEHFPSVLNDGRIVFTRWEYINRNQIALHKLWWCRPDGTGVANFYGSNSATPWANFYHDRAAKANWYADEPNRHRILPYMISETRAIPGSSKVVATAAAHHAYTAGALVIIDPAKGSDGFEPIEELTPETPYPEAEDYFTVPGNYMTPYPVNEELFFAAYSPYVLSKQGMKVPVNEYMIYLVDSLGGREPIYGEATMSCVSPIPLIPRPAPPVIPSQLPAKPTESTGTLMVQNVYRTRHDRDGVIRPGQITHLRVNEIIVQTHAGGYSAGSREDFARRILGTVPVNPDGSVVFRVPAGVPLHLQALDKNGMALLTERSLFHVMPGEERSCIGCHEDSGTPPVAGFAAMRQRPRELTPPAGPRYAGGFSFKRTVQPVLDRYCIRCHGLDKTAGGVNLLGNYGRGSGAPGMPVKPKFNNADSYATLTTRPGLLKLALRKGNAGVDSETVNSRPKDYFAHASKLIPMLRKGHEKTKLDEESLRCIIDWLDCNAIRYGDYARSKIEWRKLSTAGERAVRQYVAERFGEKLAAQPIQSLVNVAQVDHSRILKAPLPVADGGWGQIPNGWRSTDDPRYRKMQQLIEQALR